MPELWLEEHDGPIVCEGCGTELPAFLDRCPYCDDPGDPEATAACPECGAEISDLSEQCPVCEAWITWGGRGSGKQLVRRRVLAFTVIALVLVFVVLWVL